MRLHLIIAAAVSAVVVTIAGGGAVHAQAPNLSKVQIKTHKVTEGLWMLEGAGGNIGVSAGADGVFVIDDQFAPLSPRIKAAIALISQKPLRFVFNTHWHGDHVGGNESFANDGAVIVAHDNVRKRMSVEQFMSAFNRKVPPAPAKALPVVTFNDRATFHLNAHEIHVVHVAAAHTDGDSIVHFKTANVLHMGDAFVNGSYPFIDIDSGGSVNGYIAAQERALAMADESTKIIPGHGPLGDKAALTAAHDMLVKVRDRVLLLVKSGKTWPQVKAAKPTAEWDAKWGKTFISGERLAQTVYKSLVAASAKPTN